MTYNSVLLQFTRHSLGFYCVCVCLSAAKLQTVFIISGTWVRQVGYQREGILAGGVSGLLDIYREQLSLWAPEHQMINLKSEVYMKIQMYNLKTLKNFFLVAQNNRGMQIHMWTIIFNHFKQVGMF